MRNSCDRENYLRIKVARLEYKQQTEANEFKELQASLQEYIDELIQALEVQEQCKQENLELKETIRKLENNVRIFMYWGLEILQPNQHRIH